MMESSSSRLKQRLARMFRSSSLLGSACGSSTTSSVTGSTAHEPAFIPRHVSSHSFDRSFSSFSGIRHRPARFAANWAGCRPARLSETGPPPLMAKNKNKDKKERRVRETGEFYDTGEREGMTCPPASPSSPSNKDYYFHLLMGGNQEQRETKKIMKKKKKLLSNAYGFTSSSSSIDTDDDGCGFFSSEEEGETKEAENETFFSSRSFSSDSSGFYKRPSSKKKAKAKKKKKPCQRRRGQGYRPLVSVCSEKGGFAVEKRSSDPYGDFRGSMLEMIIERQLFGAKDLERLLRTYLSLNSPLHHHVILKAFSDIWEVLFCN